MSIHVRFPMTIALSVLAVTAAHARGPSPQPWLIYPAKVMDTCRAGTAPERIATRCDELLWAYAQELEACVPAPSGGPVMAAQQLALQDSDPDCAASAARIAAAKIK